MTTDTAQLTNWNELANSLGPFIGIVAVLVGTLLAGWFQWKVMSKQHRLSHKSQMDALQQSHMHNIEVTVRQSEVDHRSQLDALKAAHEQNLEVIRLNQQREDTLRTKQNQESDRADRLRIDEYADLLLPRLTDFASIHYLGLDNKDPEELNKYLYLQKLMLEENLHPAHPERSAAMRLTFLMFQLIGAFRLALNARWTRPLSNEQMNFLSHWENYIEPILCSGKYPGKELLYREQIEIVSEEMLIRSKATDIPRPINWSEFCSLLETDPVIKEIANVMATRLRFVFLDSSAPPPRKAMQCRLAIFGLYLIQISDEADNKTGSWRADRLWPPIIGWYKWEHEQWVSRKSDRKPDWSVFKRFDVAEKAGLAGAVTERSRS